MRGRVLKQQQELARLSLTLPLFTRRQATDVRSLASGLEFPWVSKREGSRTKRRLQLINLLHPLTLI